MIIDIHSHILPGLDNGSKDVDASINLLKQVKSFGVDYIVATPHYDNTKKSIADFLFDRNESYVKLHMALVDRGLNEGLDVPKIILGSEVLLTPGLEKTDALEKLCIENTTAILLEMPNTTWRTAEYSQVANLVLVNHLDIVLAHYERYTNNHKTNIANKILRLPLFVEANAASFSKMFSGKKLLESLKDNEINFVGSNLHGDDVKNANLLKFRNLVSSKLGNKELEKLDKNTAEFLHL